MEKEMSADLAAVRDLALQAGEMLLDSLGKVMKIEQKTATEFVTDVDRRVEDMLIGEIQKRFPGESILAEESGSSKGAGERTWYVDPLDGTTNYAHGYPFFSVSIACGDAKGLRFGAVFAPYLDELYLAEAGRGAVLERPRHHEARDLAKRVPVRLDHALLATGFPYVRDKTVDRNTIFGLHHFDGFLGEVIITRIDFKIRKSEIMQEQFQRNDGIFIGLFRYRPPNRKIVSPGYVG